MKEYRGDNMNKKDKQMLRNQFEYECYLRDKPYYFMIKYGFYISMCFATITYVYGLVCICMEFIFHILVVKECVLLILLSIILISAAFFVIGNIIFEIAFRKQLK